MAISVVAIKVSGTIRDIEGEVICRGFQYPALHMNYSPPPHGAHTDEHAASVRVREAAHTALHSTR